MTLGRHLAFAPLSRVQGQSFQALFMAIITTFQLTSWNLLFVPGSVLCLLLLFLQEAFLLLAVNPQNLRRTSSPGASSFVLYFVSLLSVHFWHNFSFFFFFWLLNFTGTHFHSILSDLPIYLRASLAQSAIVTASLINPLSLILFSIDGTLSFSVKLLLSNLRSKYKFIYFLISALKKFEQLRWMNSIFRATPPPFFFTESKWKHL